jgi:hypothetical protein
MEVAARIEERFRAIRAEAPAEYDELLARSKDPRFYLGLLESLSNCRIPCYGKAANPVGAGSAFSNGAPEFEIWVSRKQRGLATWVRDSFQDDYAAGEEFDPEDEQTTLGTGIEQTLSPPTKVCALCPAEYAREATLCENCGTSLFWANERVARDELALVLFNEPQPQILGAVRVALLEQRIPFNNALLYRDGLLRSHSLASSSEILVRDADFERATEVLAHLLEKYEFEPTSNLRQFVDPRVLYWPHRADDEQWLPEDLVAQAWTGHNFFQLSQVAGALREHEIPYRVEGESPKEAKLFTHPKDEGRAREILPEVMAGPAIE